VCVFLLAPRVENWPHTKLRPVLLTHTGWGVRLQGTIITDEQFFFRGLEGFREYKYYGMTFFWNLVLKQGTSALEPYVKGIYLLKRARYVLGRP